MSKLLVVTGATGAQGSAVINYFLQHEPSYKLRGLTRKPTSDAAAALSKKGVEVVQANLDDVESLKAAFAGANAIFAYTLFNEVGFSPEGMKLHFSGERSLRDAFDEEVQQGKNIADAAAGVPGLERLVWSSLPYVSKLTKGKYTHVHHFDAKGVVAEYMADKHGLEGKVSLAALGIFADNLTRLPPAKHFWGMKKYSESSYGFALPIAGKTRLPWIDVPRDTGAFVSALIKAPAGLSVEVGSEYLSFSDYVDLLSSILGFKGSFTEISAQQYCGDDPGGLMNEFAEAFMYFEEFGYAGSDPDMLTADEFEKKTGIAIPRSKIADQIKREDWSAVLE